MIPIHIPYKHEMQVCSDIILLRWVMTALMLNLQSKKLQSIQKAAHMQAKHTGETGISH